MFRDQSVERAAAEVLQDSEKRYRRLFESAKDGILILEFDTGKVVDVNPFLLQLLGYSYDALCGKLIWEIGAFKNTATSREAFKVLQDSEYIRYEDLPLETLDGRHIDVEFVSNVYLVDHAKVIQCNIRDITERNLAEDALRKSEEKHRSIIETAMDGFLLVNTEGRILEANETYSKMSGYTIKELLAMSIPDLEARSGGGDRRTHQKYYESWRRPFRVRAPSQRRDRFERRSFRPVSFR